MTDSNELRVYTIEEAAALLRCEPGWLEEQVREGKVPHLQLADSQCFTGSHLAAIVAVHEVLPKATRDVVPQRPALAWTAGEAAELLRCKASWLQRKARRHQIPCTMLGGAYDFTDGHLAEVIRIFEELPRGGAAPAPPASRSPRTAPDPGQSALKARPPRTRRGRGSDGNP